jgi:hypothetical protein
VLVGHVLVLVAVLTCLRLGWWQWNVAHEARGTIQNLGYALLWPVFAGSFIYMWLKFLHLEAERPADAAPAPRGAGGEETGSRRTRDARARDDIYQSTYDGMPGVPPAAERTRATGRERRHTRSTRPRGEVRLTGVGMIDPVGDDAELAAYNRALARLAEQDDDRAR